VSFRVERVPAVGGGVRAGPSRSKLRAAAHGLP